MIKHNNLLIHIGYHKTATTWLQGFLFNNPAAGFLSPFTIDQILHFLVLPHPLDFNARRCRAFFDLAGHHVTDNGLMLVISREELSGNPHSGGYNSKELADRLVQVFPSAKVLIVIREQKSMILSTYQQYVKVGGPMSLTEYLQPTTFDKYRIPSFEFDHFKYHRLIKYYLTLFGRSNVLVLPYELFKVKPQAFIEEIRLFCGIEGKSQVIEELPYSRRVNHSLSGGSMDLKRRLNGLIAKKSRFNPRVLFPLPRADWRLTSYLHRLDSVMPQSLKVFFDRKLQTTICELVGDRYKQSNTLTSEMLNLNLAQYGYEVDH